MLHPRAMLLCLILAAAPASAREHHPGCTVEVDLTPSDRVWFDGGHSYLFLEPLGKNPAALRALRAMTFPMKHFSTEPDYEGKGIGSFRGIPPGRYKLVADLNDNLFTGGVTIPLGNITIRHDCHVGLGLAPCHNIDINVFPHPPDYRSNKIGFLQIDGAEPALRGYHTELYAERIGNFFTTEWRTAIVPGRYRFAVKWLGSPETSLGEKAITAQTLQEGLTLEASP